jgi:DNA-binding response OmpR family regulator
MAERRTPADAATGGTKGPTVRVLVVVSDPAVGRSIAAMLDRAPYEARVERSVPEADRALKGWRPDIAVIDVDAGVARAIVKLADDRAIDRLPIVALTRSGDRPQNNADVLDAGVDDIVTGPMVPEELRAHIRALLRRTWGPYRPVLTLRVGALEINLVERSVIANGVRIHLTSLEQALLYLLAATPGTVVSRDAILDALWGQESAPEANVLERHISRLRAKLGRHAPDAYRIETVRREGYRLRPTRL